MLPRILYIAGYGRSGSTVLGTLLGAHPQVTHVGEAAFLPDDRRSPNRVCSCGARYDRCPFWAEACTGDAEREGRIARRVERFAALPGLLLGLVPRRTREAYASDQRRLFGHAAATAGTPIVVDSSKSAWATAGRALALGRLAGFEVFVLHLVRDGRATFDSLVKTGSNWELEKHRGARRAVAFRAAVGWTVSNLCVSALRPAYGPGRYLRLRYEDLVADPEGSLRRIGEFIGIDPEPLVARVARGDTFDVGHVVGGNRVRFQGMIALQRPNPPRPAPGTRSPRRLAFAIVGAWLNRRYGYHQPGPID
jgi:hypothetical protein